MSTPDRGVMQFLTRQWPLVIAVCVGSSLAHVGTSTMPFQVGALMDGRAISSGQAGLFGLFEVGALAMGMFLIAGWIDRLPIRVLAISSALLSATANIARFFARAFPIQLLGGAAAGLGYGCVFAATIASAAASDEADRLYAFGNGGSLLLIMVIMATLPIGATRFGALGIFIGIAALALVSCAFFSSLKRSAHIRQQRVAAWHIQGVPGLLFSWASFSTGTGALYAFCERIGKSIHLAPQTEPSAVGWKDSAMERGPGWPACSPNTRVIR